MDRTAGSKRPYPPSRMVDWVFAWYYAYGNTPAEDLLEQFDFVGAEGGDPTILSLGCGDVRSCFYTLWKHFDPAISSRRCVGRPTGVRFVLNDVSAAVIARDVLFVYLTLKLPPWTQREAAKQWIASMWAIWYCHELLPSHEETLKEALATLLKLSDTMKSWEGSQHAISQVVSFTDDGTRAAVRRMWDMWLTKSFGSVETMKEKMSGERSTAHVAKGLNLFEFTMIREIQLWLNSVGFNRQETMDTTMLTECIRYGLNGTVFAEDCLDIEYSTGQTSVNPTMFEREDGLYSLHYTCTPYECFHHGLFVSKSQIQRLGLDKEIPQSALIIEDNTFWKQPLRSNCIQQFSMWVSSSAAALTSQVSQQKRNISFVFNCSDCVHFCEDLQTNSGYFRKRTGFPPLFDTIYTSNLIDRIAPPIIVQVTKQLLKTTGCLLTTTFQYKQVTNSTDLFLHDLFGFGPEWLPMIYGMRCVSHDGKFSDTTAIFPKHCQVDRSGVLVASRIFCPTHKTLLWQRVDSQPMIITSLPAESLLAGTLHDSIHTAIMSFFDECTFDHGSPVRRVMCTETAIRTVLMFVSQLDADVDISQHTFWDDFCSLIQGNTELRSFFVHIQTQALLHGLHFHLTVTDTDCPICLKKPLENYALQFSVEFDPRSMNPILVFPTEDPTPVYVVYIHKNPEIYRRVWGPCHNLVLNDHVIDSAHGVKSLSGKIRLSFFFPAQFVEENYLYTVVRFAAGKLETPLATLTGELSQLKVLQQDVPFHFQIAGVFCNKTTYSSLGNVLSHSGDASSMETVLSIASKPFSFISSKTNKITLKHTSVSSIKVACGKYNLTITYPYPVDYYKTDVQVSRKKCTVTIHVPRATSHIYNEQRVFYINPSDLVMLPSWKVSAVTAEVFGQKQFTANEETILHIKERPAECNVKFLCMSLMMLCNAEVFEFLDPSSSPALGINNPVMYILVHRRVCDVVRYTPVLDVYYYLCEGVISPKVAAKVYTMMREIVSADNQRLLSRPIDNGYPIMKKMLEYYASRTRPTRNHSSNILSRYGLEKQFTRALIYPLYCDQDFANNLEDTAFMKKAEEAIKIPIDAFSSSPTLTPAYLPSALTSSSLSHSSSTVSSSTVSSSTVSSSTISSSTISSSTISSSSTATAPLSTAKSSSSHKSVSVDRTKCSYCGDKPGKLKKCTGCSKTYYCGKDCQVKHWKEHKKVCKTMVAQETLTKCSNCGEETAYLKRCAACQVAAYCSKECQRNDWTRHKLSCTATNHSKK